MKRCSLLLSLLLIACTANPVGDVSRVRLQSAGSESATQFDPNMGAGELAENIRAGNVTAEEAVRTYLARIEALDRHGPKLGSIISLNSDALAQARQLDREAAEGHIRGMLHGVPIVVKDVLETQELPTTAGSLALAENDTKRDSTVVARLREAGAIILAKTNLSEWANHRSKRAVAGWSAIGGHTRNPYDPERSPCGSSSGSAVAVSARFAPLAIGTETNRSIICPSAVNGIVGYKPTIGLLPQTHIVPVTATFDTPGPMARSVRDAALMLTVMAGGDGSVGGDRSRDFLAGLDQGIEGMRIGVFRWAEGNDPTISALFEDALGKLRLEGAILVDIREFSPSADVRHADLVMKAEFKAMLNAYLATSAPEVSVRSLEELIAFNELHADRELQLFDQSVFMDAQQTQGLQTAGYGEAKESLLRATRELGIDQLLSTHDVDVIVMPAGPPGRPLATQREQAPRGPPIGATWLPALAGYPILTVPMGVVEEGPVGLAITGTASTDAEILAVGHAFEQARAPIAPPPLEFP